MPDRYEGFTEDDLGTGDPKCPLVLLLDNSESMGWPRNDEHEAPLPLAIKELNRGLVELSKALSGNAIAKRRVEVQVVTFGEKVRQVGDFTTAQNWKPPHLSAAGRTPMGAAITRGLSLVRSRRKALQKEGHHVYRPWIFLLTDGEPTDDMQGVKKRIAEAERSKEVVFWCIAAKGANLDCLRSLVPADRPILRPEENDWTSLFRWMSAAVSRRASVRPGEQVTVPAWHCIA